jgi:GrpB-like predicted nucleotidyltransferase (UPF0157 family)
VPESFSDDPGHAFLNRLRGGKRTHHLHLVSASLPHPERYLLLRDYLRPHPDAAARYETVKRDLAARYPTARDRYLDEKHVVVELLIEASRSAAQSRGSAPSPTPFPSPVLRPKASRRC